MSENDINNENINQNTTKNNKENVEDKSSENTSIDIENNKIQQLETENKDLKDKLLRTLAELENTRRIHKEEIEKANKYAITNISKDLIAVMENFYLSLKNYTENDFEEKEKTKSFFEAVKLNQNELKKVFEKYGLTRINPIDEIFNPDFHEAIAHLESDKEEGTIIDVAQPGYLIKDRLLRPALVAVAKKKE